MILEGANKVEQYPHSCSDSPLVSIVVVTYNHINFIEQCVTSLVEQQTTFDYEILIGEDNSNDGTRELCIELAKKHNTKIRLFLHDRENVILIGGKPTGRFNFTYGLQNSSGKYIALCDGDDFWTDAHKLQKQVDFLEKNSTYSLCGGLWNLREQGVIKEDSIIKNNKSQSEYTTQDFINFSFSPLHTSTVLFTKNIFKSELWDWHAFTKFPSGDMPIFFILSLQGKIHRFQSYFATRNVAHRASITKSRTIGDILNSLLFTLEYFDKISKYKFSTRINEEKKFFKSLNDYSSSTFSYLDFFFLFQFRKRLKLSIRDIIYTLRKRSKR